MEKMSVGFFTSKPFHPASAINFDTEGYELKILDGDASDGLISLYLKENVVEGLCNGYPDDEKLIRKWSFYLSFLNCIYLLLESYFRKHFNGQDYFEIYEITVKEAFGITNIANNQISYIPQKPSHFMFAYSPELAARRNIIEIPGSVFQSLNEDLKRIYGDYDKVQTLSQITKSLAEYKMGNFSTSIVLIWFIIEKLLSIFWERLLEDKNIVVIGNRKRINSKRKQALLDNRAYPISVKLNMLEFHDKIDLETFEKADSLRRLRNDIVHPNANVICKAENCIVAFELIKLFIKNEYNIELNLNYSFSRANIS